ncbi:protein kinase [Verrucomicrobiales bacterium BCK34]|nr:protein kinase [Verrucomicrobiales bacterium BCK34]
MSTRKGYSKAELLRLGLVESSGQWMPISAGQLDPLMPGYSIHHILGRGGMGVVYLATQVSLKRPVAVKVLPPELGSDLEFEARFRREAEAMARLNHPNIIQIYDFGKTEDGHFFFVMEFVENGDLHSMIRAGHLDPDVALNIVVQICDGLHYAHSKGYVHRDIKPANILLNGEGVVKIGDFGLAKLIDPAHGSETDLLGITVTGISMGTPNYIAPEQISGSGEIDQRVDIYSLGVMLYEMLTGEIPRGSFAPPSAKIGSDIRIDDVVLKAMDENREMRYQSAVNLQSDLSILQNDPGKRTAANLERRGRESKWTARKVRLIDSSGAKSGGRWPVRVAALLLILGLLSLAVTLTREKEASIRVIESSNIQLSPTLAAMKARGGFLRGWGTTDDSTAIETQFSQVASSDNFVRIRGMRITDPTQWMARKADGSLVHFPATPEGGTIGHNFDFDRPSPLVTKEGTEVLLFDPSAGRFNRANSFSGQLMQLDRKFKTVSGTTYDRIAALAEDGSVHLVPLSHSVQSFSYSLVERLSKLSDAVEISKNGISGAILRADGTVMTWFGGELPEVPPNVRDIVRIAAGRQFYMALDRKGEIHVWAAPSQNSLSQFQLLAIPGGLPRCVEIRAADHIAAVQLEDGTWVAWGDDREGVVSFINELGPAVDIDFGSHRQEDETWKYVYWIEPAELPVAQPASP